MEITKSIRFETMGCRECLSLVLDSLRSIDGVLMVMIRGNEIVLTYDNEKVLFSDLMNMILMHGLALYLRRIVLRLGNSRELNQEELHELYRKFDDLVNINQDIMTHRIYIIMHPDSNPKILIDKLRQLDIQVSEPLTDELIQVRLSMS